jgi:hypothetical protein
MDISKAGSAAAVSNPAAEGPKVGADGAAGADKKFADVLAHAHSQPGIQQPNASQFAAPILDNDLKIGSRVSGAGHRRGPEVVGERAGTAPSASGPAASAQNGPLSPVSLQRLANDTMKAESKMDAMIEAARKGKTFSASELLAIQVEVFRYSQTVEVISRSTDKLVGAIKQTLGTQV